jgi:hypothetical protein
MTPKEKAEDLINKFYIKGDMLKESHSYRLAKKCALISVDEILDFMMNDDKESETCYWANHPLLSYWYQVKQEIEKL